MKKWICTLAMTLLLTVFVSAIENPFVDVDVNSDQGTAILWALDMGITAGTSETTFSPDALCTRGQVVTFLWRYAGSPTPTQTTTFLDVGADSPYGTAVAWAVETGVSDGISALYFDPDSLCNTAQILTMLHRSQGLPVGSGTLALAYPDTYFAKALAWAEEVGLVETFNPESLVSRGEMAQYLYDLAGAPEVSSTQTTQEPILPADQNEVTTPFVIAMQDKSIDVAGSKYGALPENLAAGSQLVSYSGIAYFFRNNAQTISAMLPDGSSAIWDLYTAPASTLTHMQIYGDKLYFLEETEEGATTLCAMNLDGSGHTVLWENTATLDLNNSLLYDGRFYFLASEQTTVNTIVSYDLTMGDETVVYVHSGKIYTGEGLSLGVADGRLYFCQTRSFGRQGDAYSVTLSGDDLQFEEPEALIGTGICTSMMTASTSATVLLPSTAGVLSCAHVNETLYPELQDVYINGIYAFSVDGALPWVNVVSPTQLFTQGVLFSIDGATVDLVIADTGSSVTALPQSMLVDRSVYEIIA